jgi:hypothetical protein
MMNFLETDQVGRPDDEDRINQLMAALEPFAFITLEDCQYCSEIIWPGPDHYNECPVATARRALLGIGEFG